MGLNLLIPDINEKPENSKDAVISILTLDWPLSLRNIFYKIKKQYRYSSSYQSVYKAVKELSASEVLIKKEFNIGFLKELKLPTQCIIY